MVFLQYTDICFSKLYCSPNFITDTQEAGVFFDFVEFEDMSGIQNALNVSFPTIFAGNPTLTLTVFKQYYACTTMLAPSLR